MELDRTFTLCEETRGQTARFPHSMIAKSNSSCAESRTRFRGRPPFCGASVLHNVRSICRTNSSDPSGRPVCVLRHTFGNRARHPCHRMREWMRTRILSENGRSVPGFPSLSVFLWLVDRGFLKCHMGIQRQTAVVRHTIRASKHIDETPGLSLSFSPLSFSPRAALLPGRVNSADQAVPVSRPVSRHSGCGP